MHRKYCLPNQKPSDNYLDIQATQLPNQVMYVCTMEPKAKW